MKKTYIQPSIEVCTINVKTILAGSMINNEEGDGKQLSKESDLWDDLEDDNQ